MRRFCAFLLLTLIAATPAIAQVQSRPTNLPLLTAENESWYVNGEPLQFAGEISAGPAVPITPESFRVVGSYEGFPVFARKDGSEQVIYVPTRAGLAAPYRLQQ